MTKISFFETCIVNFLYFRGDYNAGCNFILIFSIFCINKGSKVDWRWFGSNPTTLQSLGIYHDR